MSPAPTVVAVPTPRDLDWQRCLSHELVIEPDAADRSTSRDAYGNISSYSGVTERHRTLSDHQPLRSRGGSAWSPNAIRWVHPRGRRGSWPRPVGGDSGALAAEFDTGPSPPEITDAVRSTPHRVRARTAADRRCCANWTSRIIFRLHLPVGFDDGVHRRWPRCWRRSARECTGLRPARHRLPARQRRLAASYVSGYLATDPPPGKERMISGGRHAPPGASGLDTSRTLRLGMDPTNDQMVDTSATSLPDLERDYADVPRLRGIIYAIRTVA